jgi:uncharacterized repeat protein (TIGR02543 family)
VNRTLAVQKDPAGQPVGIVSSSDGRIDCGLGCSGDTATFASGTEVHLSAQAAAGYTFQGWTGDCGGSGTCTVTMRGDRSVVAHFSSAGIAGDSQMDARRTPLRTRLALPGGRGDVVVDGRTVSVGAGAEVEIVFDGASGDHLVEAWAREGTGEGVWRFAFAPGDSGARRITAVLGGEPVTVTPDAIVFRIRGRLPQKVSFVVRMASAGGGPPPP